MPTELPTEHHVFEVWAVANRGRYPDGLNPRSTAMYRSLWDAWCAWLGRQGKGRLLAWHEAVPEHLERFFEGPPPGERARAASRPQQMKPYTAARYFRVLSGVYGLAAASGQLVEDPCLALKESRGEPTVGEEQKAMQLLPPELWRRLRDLDVLACHFAGRSRWTDLRDHAMAVVLVEAGLTSSEITRLAGKHVIDPLTERPVDLGHLVPAPRGRGRPPKNEGPDLLRYQADFFKRPAGEALRLDVVADRNDEIERTLPLSIGAARTLIPYMCERLRRVNLTAGLQEGGKSKLAADGPLFARTRSSQDDPYALEPMDFRTLHTAIANLVRTVWEEMGGDEKSLQHAGPAVVRNCVIRSWAADLSRAGHLSLEAVEVEVLRRAGLGPREGPRVMGRVGQGH